MNFICGHCFCSGIVSGVASRSSSPAKATESVESVWSSTSAASDGRHTSKDEDPLPDAAAGAVSRMGSSVLETEDIGLDDRLYMRYTPLFRMPNTPESGIEIQAGRLFSS